MMSTGPKSLAEITSRAIEVLVRELGPADAIRFINQFSTGHGNYTASRDATFGELTLDQLLLDLKGRPGEATGPSPA